jgi:undecaprenyl pyrophosphate synthase
LNNDNLIRFTEETAREFGARGAAAANRKKREKKTMQSLLKTLLDSKLTDTELREKIKAAGIKDADVTNGMAMLYAMFQSTLGGSSKAFSALMDLLGKELATGKDDNSAQIDNKITIEFVDNRAELSEDTEKSAVDENNEA